MKKIFKNIRVLALTMFVLASCTKDEERLTVNPGEAPVLTSSSNELMLSSESAADTVISFSWNVYNVEWSQPDLSTSIAKYTLEIDSTGQNFSSPYQIDMTGKTAGKYSGSGFNALLLNSLQLPADRESSLEVRLKAAVSTNIAPVYSNVVSMKVTPYAVSSIPEYPSLFVVGSHQGWSPPTAPAIRSAKNDGVYEGYVNFHEAKTEFKLTTARDWDHPAYGDAGPGLLSATGGNVVQEGAGYYLIKFNDKTMSWSATKTAWGLIGEATPGGWDADTPLTYDQDAKVWKGTFALKTGKYKFRANGNWDVNLGVGSSAGVLSYGGQDLELTVAGTYDVTLDLSNGAYYMYKLIKK